MVTLRRPPGRFARVGHRGASALAPENTLEALELAVELGCDMLELDILPLLDGTLVVAHPDLLELARGVARGPVRRRTRSELEVTMPKLPTLDDVLAFCAARLAGIVLQLDLKRRGVEEAVVASLRRNGAVDRAWISAFDPVALRRVAELAPDLPRSYTLPRDRFGIAKRRPFAPLVRGARTATGSSLPRQLPSLLRQARAGAATLHHSIASPEVIRRAHDVGAAVYVWTVDDVALAQRLVDAGADGIITNDPRIFGSLKA
jgi:glycerophosphoryl diester phosphodiesterase